MTGRPSIFTQELADLICERLSLGESLRTICLDDALPSTSTICRWLADDEKVTFREQYVCAREAQADVLADEILQIADTPQEGTTIIDKPTGREVKTGDMIEHRRLQVDARKWYASKVAPKKYGDKITQEVVGKDGSRFNDTSTTVAEIIGQIAAAKSTGGAVSAPMDSEGSAKPDNSAR
jgi:hypothetical protein